jgi:hypothetical protein
MAWTGSEDDKTLVSGEYTLRVEQMDEKHFWWNVSYKGKEIYSDSLVNIFANTMSKAQFLAIHYKNTHIIHTAVKNGKL